MGSSPLPSSLFSGFSARMKAKSDKRPLTLSRFAPQSSCFDFNPPSTQCHLNSPSGEGACRPGGQLLLQVPLNSQTSSNHTKKMETLLRLNLISMPGPPPSPPGTSWCMWWRPGENTSCRSPTPPTPSTPLPFSSSSSSSSSTHISAYSSCFRSSSSLKPLSQTPTWSALCGLSSHLHLHSLDN